MRVFMGLERRTPWKGPELWPGGVASCVGGLSGKEFDSARHEQFTSPERNDNSMSKLTGKVAVVTGASKGIGAAIAKSLAAEGASVVVNYASSKAGADSVVAAITAAGGKAVAVRGDVSKAAEAQDIIEAAIKNYGRLDILINNSGVYEFAPIEAITEDHFHRHFNINVLGLLLATQAAVKYLGEGGSTINMGSVVSRITPPEQRGLLQQQGRSRHHHQRAVPRARPKEDPGQHHQSRHSRD
jgi:NAD(P)-dependent dehydrogenase (short-subunit alcohol dehydrogenase family)